jgi:hypothetical protein
MRIVLLAFAILQPESVWATNSVREYDYLENGAVRYGYNKINAGIKNSKHLGVC